MTTMAAIIDSPTTTAALWQHHILAALPPRDSEEYEYSKLMHNVAIGIHALTAASKNQTNVSTFATLFQSAAQKLRERESFSAVTRLGHNVIAHNAVRSKRSAVNEANKIVSVVNTTADDVHQNASRVRIVNQTLKMTVCQPSSRQHVHALANLRPCTRPKAAVRGSCKGRVSQLNHFDVQVQAHVCYREVKTWHIRIGSWCELEFTTDSTYYELVTREDCITAVNHHTAKLPSNKGILDFAPRKDWVDTILNVENNDALISNHLKLAECQLFSLDLVGLPTINK